jgi:hypothetical protein
MSTERRQMDDDTTMSSDEIRPDDPGATPLVPTSMSDRKEGNEETDGSLLPSDRTSEYRERWDAIQSRFVDDPRSSVEQADRLVIEVVQDLQTTFGSERRSLEDAWQRGDDVQTEDLRVALQRYRTFFDRLLAA